MKWYKKKKFVIPMGILLVLIALRIVLQPVLLNVINDKLANFSPTIEGHADDLDIAILRGSFGVDQLSMKLKKSGKEFLRIKDADLSLAWREILKGNFMADALVDGVNITLYESLPEAIKKSIPPEDKDQPKKKPPGRISRVDWKNVNIIVPTHKIYTNQGPFRLSHIQGRITNLFADTETSRSFFNIQGTGSGTSNFKAVGSANLNADPVEWDLDAQMQGFDLPSMNRFLLNKVPLTFTKGTFDMYSEVKSEEGKIRGYVKPFVEDLDFIKQDENFKGTKHWIVEVAGAIGNWILKAHKDDTIATKVPFSFDGKNFSVDSGSAVGNVIKHGFDQELSPGVDASMKMQAQEAKKEAKETERENEKKEEKNEQEEK
jgi:hypothetical protein